MGVVSGQKYLFFLEVGPRVGHIRHSLSVKSSKTPMEWLVSVADAVVAFF